MLKETLNSVMLYKLQGIFEQFYGQQDSNSFICYTNGMLHPRGFAHDICANGNYNNPLCLSRFACSVILHDLNAISYTYITFTINKK